MSRGGKCQKLLDVLHRGALCGPTLPSRQIQRALQHRINVLHVARSQSPHTLPHYIGAEREQDRAHQAGYSEASRFDVVERMAQGRSGQVAGNCSDDIQSLDAVEFGATDDDGWASFAAGQLTLLKWNIDDVTALVRHRQAPRELHRKLPRRRDYPRLL